MSLAKKFWGTCGDSQFKIECHTKIVKSFDPGAEIWEHKTNPFDECGYYSTLTCVEFSDGSKTAFNYKGEQF